MTMPRERGFLPEGTPQLGRQMSHKKRGGIPMEHVERIAVMLYGPRWIQNLAHDLGNERSSVARWRQGGYAPRRVLEFLMRRADERKEDLTAAVTKLVHAAAGIAQ